MLHEAVVKANPQDAQRALTQYGKAAARIDSDSVIELREFNRRARISKAKIPFMIAIKSILEDLKEYWPLNYRKFRGRGEDSAEKFLGADGVFELIIKSGSSI